MYKLPTVLAKPKLLTASDWVAVADRLGVEEAALRAVADVESSGSGFLASGKPKILFEAHIFSRLTNGLYNVSNPQISSQQRNRALYKGGEREYARLIQAICLDSKAALESASWGKFQIMGFNHSLCGYSNVIQFVEAHYQSEVVQLSAFATFLKSRRLDKHLQAKDWEAFARGYNGSGYKTNKYDSKLKQAYDRRSGK